MTARGDWQASGPLRSLASPTGGRPDQSPLLRGVPEHKEWNVFSNWEPAQPARVLEWDVRARSRVRTF